MLKIIPSNTINWKFDGDSFTSRDYPTMLRRRDKLQGVIQSKESIEDLQTYNESLLTFKATIGVSERWEIRGEKGSEYMLVLDGKDNSIGHYWSSRNLDRLHTIAYEYTLKERYLNV